MNGKHTKIKNHEIFLRFIKLSNNWSIAKKISYGYTVAISIALIGTISGLVIANSYERNAQKRVEFAEQQQNLLKNLENSVTRMRLHPQRLVTVLDDSIWLEFEKNKFLNGNVQVNKQIAELEIFINKSPYYLALGYTEYQSFLQKYQININSYTQLFKNFWQQIETDSLQAQKPQDLHNKLLILLLREEIRNINIKFDKLSDELILIIGNAENQKQQAITSFTYARKLRIQVIACSVILSLIIAAALAVYTSKLIAHPLQLVTKIAQQITQESNFQLRVNVSSKDEVGTLAASLNQLVEWVGNYTQELEIARQTLEKRVEERTQELQQAHHTLEEKVEERTQELQQALQDLKATQGQLIQTEKMSSLGQMVAGIAHEINNPVNFIHGNIECASGYIQDLINLINLYQQEYPEPSYRIAENIEDIDLDFITEDLSHLLSSMKMGSQRIREIVLSLRNFSRLDEADMKAVNIHEGIDNTLLILNHRLKLGIEIIKIYGDLPLIECYPAQLNQVFMNILNNALDALLDYSNKRNKQIIINTSLVNNNCLKISIKDNGPGIRQEIMSKLFDPFFTTKPVGKGTGLGLSISYQIIEKHKGKIEINSAIDEGTEFTITLPIKAENLEFSRVFNENKYI
ncbi:HAMP domain-containing protein [Tolypothrix sp. FACHB-123]|uniref:sensor histidine kinase n=1 Tax=Tolypothrix sp. FACHB-123 TaxID=2692868 RepID=UPI00168789C7|nr:ATP-binding protein [Tolypothrix sp. FACHB-123]MBD2356668.1 HAMP domain-containing protein [Tolypothrix sp. FACHB-123]